MDQQEGGLLEEQAGPEEDSGRAGKIVNEVYEWVEWLAGIAVCVVLVLSFGVRTVGVFGISMESTLIEGDSLLVTRLGGAPQYGDIIAITQPNSSNLPLIKRVIATGGQTIEVDHETGEVRVDGVPLPEPYINERESYPYDVYTVQYPVTVPEGCLFVMGDNRNHSLDSRSLQIGMIDNRYVLGKAFFRFAPFDRIGRP